MSVISGCSSNIKPIALPGYVWGKAGTTTNSVNGHYGMGVVNQGADWEKFGDYTLNTFLEVRALQRTKNREYNNTLGPAVGTALKFPGGRIAADFYQEHLTAGSQINNVGEIFIEFYHEWDFLRP